jgi:hypothetical protein
MVFRYRKDRHVFGNGELIINESIKPLGGNVNYAPTADEWRDSTRPEVCWLMDALKGCIERGETIEVSPDITNNDIVVFEYDAEVEEGYDAGAFATRVRIYPTNLKLVKREG